MDCGERWFLGFALTVRLGNKTIGGTWDLFKRAWKERETKVTYPKKEPRGNLAKGKTLSGRRRLVRGVPGVKEI